MEILDGSRAKGQDVLDFRDEKSKIIEKHLDKGLICLTISAVSPGEVKNSKAYRSIIDSAFELLKKSNTIKIQEKIIIDRIGGYCIILGLSNENGKEIKELTVSMEEKLPWGRIIDLDVIDKNKSYTRTSLGFKERTCLVCEDSAHLCARSRKHDINEILLKINNIYVKNFIKKNGNISIDNM